jgi:hypothetical protein
MLGEKSSVADLETSVLIRSLNVIEEFLECKIYVKHIPRTSNPVMVVADALSRQETFAQELLTNKSIQFSQLSGEVHCKKSHRHIPTLGPDDAGPSTGLTENVFNIHV